MFSVNYCHVIFNRSTYRIQSYFINYLNILRTWTKSFQIRLTLPLNFIFYRCVKISYNIVAIWQRFHIQTKKKRGSNSKVLIKPRSETAKCIHTLPTHYILYNIPGLSRYLIFYHGRKLCIIIIIIIIKIQNKIRENELRVTVYRYTGIPGEWTWMTSPSCVCVCVDHQA